MSKLNEIATEQREQRTLEDLSNARQRQHNSTNAKHIREAINEGLEGSAKVMNAQARITVALINAFRSGEEKASEADDYMSREPSDAQKKNGKQYLQLMCGTYSQAYCDAQDAMRKIDEDKGSADKEGVRIAYDKHRATVAAVQQMLYRCIVAAYYAYNDCNLTNDAKYNPKDGSIRLEGFLDGKDNDEDVMRVSVSRLFDMAARIYRRKRAANPEGQDEGNEGETASVVMSLKGASAFLTKELTGMSAADIEASTRGELQALLVTLIGVFGGVKAIGAIYSKDDASATLKRQAGKRAA